MADAGNNGGNGGFQTYVDTNGRTWILMHSYDPNYYDLTDRANYYVDEQERLWIRAAEGNGEDDYEGNGEDDGEDDGEDHGED
jgi:hypothetical protein